MCKNILVMKKFSISDSVVISLALRSEIRRYVKMAKVALEVGEDISPFIDCIKDYIHAYNSVNDVPFDTDDMFLLRFL